MVDDLVNCEPWSAGKQAAKSVAEKPVSTPKKEVYGPISTLGFSDQVSHFFFQPTARLPRACRSTCHAWRIGSNARSDPCNWVLTSSAGSDEKLVDRCEKQKRTRNSGTPSRHHLSGSILKPACNDMCTNLCMSCWLFFPLVLWSFREKKKKKHLSAPPVPHVPCSAARRGLVVRRGGQANHVLHLEARTRPMWRGREGLGGFWTADQSLQGAVLGWVLFCRLKHPEHGCPVWRSCFRVFF